MSVNLLISIVGFLLFFLAVMLIVFLGLKPEIDYGKSFILGTCKSISLFTTSRYCCEVVSCSCNYCSNANSCSIIETLPQYSGNKCCSSSTCCKQESCITVPYESCTGSGNSRSCTTRWRTVCNCIETINQLCSYVCGTCYNTHLTYQPMYPIPDTNLRSTILKCGVNATDCKINNELQYKVNNTWNCYYNTEDQSIVFDNNYKVSAGLIAGTVILSLCALISLSFIVFFLYYEYGNKIKTIAYTVGNYIKKLFTTVCNYLEKKNNAFISACYKVFNYNEDTYIAQPTLERKESPGYDGENAFKL